MVFQTAMLMIRSRGPDEFWRKRKIFRLAAHYIGKRRNCYTVAIKFVHRALVYATKARKLKKEDMRDLWETRLNGACEEYNTTYRNMNEGLDRCNIMLDRKVLADLAVWEPRTFASLASISIEKMRDDMYWRFKTEECPTGEDLEEQAALRNKLSEE